VAREETEAFFADLKLLLTRPARTDEHQPPSLSQLAAPTGVKAIIWTLKRQLGLEHHAGRPSRLVGPRPPKPARSQHCDLAQLGHRRPGQALLDRLRPLTALTSHEFPVNDLVGAAAGMRAVARLVWAHSW
jgi:hypothetical protein